MTARARTYTLASVIDQRVESRLRDVHTACPGRIVRYDKDEQQVDVQPLVQVIYLDEAGERQTESLPVVVNVPVIFPGAGGFRITFPVKAGDEDGDTCLLIFSESSLDRWLDQGEGPIDPGDDRRFHLSDGFAVLGLRDFAHALASARDDCMTIGKDTGIQVYIDGGEIRIGDNDAPNLEPAALGTAVANALASIASKLSSHTHTVTGSSATGGPVTGTTAPSANAAPSIGTVTSNKVKVAK